MQERGLSCAGAAIRRVPWGVLNLERHSGEASKTVFGSSRECGWLCMVTRCKSASDTLQFSSNVLIGW
jgi:hypothetical protein